MTIAEALAWGAETLSRSQELIFRSRADSALLLRHVLGIDAAEMFAHDERVLSFAQAEQFQALIEQRRSGKPIQYITGRQEFFGLPFHVTADVLIPRPETEHLVEAAIARLRGWKNSRIVDVGTGSGAIAVALAHALPACQMTALDISAAALEVARENAQRNGVAGRIRFLQSDLLAAVAGERFDAVISNPPYISLSERGSLPVEVHEYEPALALFAGATGLEIYERLIVEATPFLVSGGWLLMAIGYGQREAIEAMLRGWDAVEFLSDLQGIARVAVARKL